MENKLHLTTPLVYSSQLSARFESNIYLKPENLQLTNSFKIRGASNFCNTYLELNAAPKGFCTHSSGNHGKALAYVCFKRGISCKIVVPKNAPVVKIEAMKALGAEIIFCEPDTASRLAAVKEIEVQGYVQVPPYDHEWIMEGQGSVAEEILTECPELDGIICPVGGGGLSGGISKVLQNTDKLLVGAEPYFSDDAFRSLETGVLCTNDRFDTVADGLRANFGKLNFEQLKACDFFEIIRCTEQAIQEAASYALNEEKLLIEKSSATAIAILPEMKENLKGKTWVIVLSGGNVDPSNLL